MDRIRIRKEIDQRHPQAGLGKRQERDLRTSEATEQAKVASQSKINANTKANARWKTATKTVPRNTISL